MDRESQAQRQKDRERQNHNRETNGSLGEKDRRLGCGEKQTDQQSRTGRY